MDDFILLWNIQYPLDRWWRKKHGIPFGSQQHLSQSVESIVFEFKEDALYRKISLSSHQYKEGDWISQGENFEKNLYNNLDLSNIE